MQIVDAAPDHLEAIARIYAAEVEGSPATFDLETPPVERWEEALQAADPARGHFLLAAIDDDGCVLGYAKSGRFRDRAAYDTTCETSIYVAAEARGQGVGRTLYAGLLERLEASPLRVAVAAMTEPNPASAALHRSLGFSTVGTLEGVGVKFGRPWSVTWFQRDLNRSSAST
jgi:phosphinothricin acetyltransferase